MAEYGECLHAESCRFVLCRYSRQAIRKMSNRPRPRRVEGETAMRHSQSSSRVLGVLDQIRQSGRLDDQRDLHETTSGTLRMTRPPVALARRVRSVCSLL